MYSYYRLATSLSSNASDYGLNSSGAAADVGVTHTD